MKYLRSLWRRLTIAVPKEHWITARCGPELWHGERADMPPGHVVIKSHASYLAMIEWAQNTGCFGLEDLS